MHQTRKGQQWYFGMKLQYRGGQPHRAIAQRRGHRSQRARQAPAARSAARRRAARLWRQRLRQPEAAYRVKARHRPLTPSPTASRGAATSTRPCARRTASPGARPRRARVRRGQAAGRGVPSRLPRFGQERHALVCGAGSGQHLPRAKNTIWTGASIAHDKRNNLLAARPKKPSASGAMRVKTAPCSPEIPPNRGVPREVAYWMALGGYLFSVAFRTYPG